MLETQYDFATKYTKTNAISRSLINGFYGGIEELVKPLQVQSALEVGCGEGFSTARLRQMLPQEASLEASDVEDRLVALAKQRNPGMAVSQESIYNLSRPDKSIDLVFVLEVLEHLDDPARGLAEICRVSRRWILASVPNEPTWRVMNMLRLKYLLALGNTPGHLQHWSSQGFCKFISSHARISQLKRPLPWTLVLAEVL